MTHPATGGSYIRDAKTGELTRERTTKPESIPAETAPEAAMPESQTTKKGAK